MTRMGTLSPRYTCRAFGHGFLFIEPESNGIRLLFAVDGRLRFAYFLRQIVGQVRQGENVKGSFWGPFLFGR